MKNFLPLILAAAAFAQAPAATPNAASSCSKKTAVTNATATWAKADATARASPPLI